MQSTTSAHSIKSADTGVGASLFVPAEIASTPGYEENTTSAVGLRSRFWLHTNSNFISTFIRTTAVGAAAKRSEDRLSPGVIIFVSLAAQTATSASLSFLPCLPLLFPVLLLFGLFQEHDFAQRKLRGQPLIRDTFQSPASNYL